MPSSMGDARQADAGRAASEALGYETRDANTLAVLGFLAVLALVLVATLLGTWLTFRYFAVANRPPIPGSTFSDVRQVPLGPELQVNPREDLLKTYAEQQQLIESYSWEDRKTGTVRIPIERAMDLLLQKGLPVVPSAAGDNATSGNAAAEKSNGASGEPSDGQQKDRKENE